MKSHSLPALLAIALFVCCGTARQTPQQKAEEEKTSQAVRQKLDERSYRIDVTYMMPMRGPSQAVNAYSITVDGSTIDSHLPYFGEAHNIPYGGGKGLTFKEEMESYKDNGWKKDCRNIVIQVKNEEDSYVFTLDVFDNGEVSVQVHCQNRDDISYRGALNF